MPETEHDLYQQAQTALASKDMVSAIKLLGKTIEINPEHAAALTDLARISYDMGKPQVAHELATRALELDQNAPSLHLLLGQTNKFLNNLQSATHHWEESLRLAPNQLAPYSNLLKQAMLVADIKQDKAIVSDALFTHAPNQFFRFQIEITTWCNLKCAGCPRTIAIEDGTWKNTHMSLETFTRILEHTPPSESLCLQGVGESTLHPQFREMIAYAKSTGKYNQITINSNILARPISYYEKLKEEGLEYISVSVDSFTPEIAEACRAGTDTEKLKKRLGEILKLYTNKHLFVTIVVSKRNLEDLPRTLTILNDMGPLMVEIQSLIVYDPDKGEDGNNSVALDEQDLAKLVAESQKKELYPNIIFNGTTLKEGNSKFRCMRPFTSPYVTVDGFLTPCCTSQDPSLLGYTDISKMTWQEAWIRPEVSQWVKSYVKNTHAICKGCCFYSG